MIRPEDIRYEPHPSLGKIDDVPVPPREILKYAKDMELLRFKGLTLHVLTTLVVANLLISDIQKANAQKSEEEQFDINPDLVFETMVAYHSARPLAEDGVAKRSSEAINQYMKEHDDVELAVLMGGVDHLPVSVIQEIEHLESARGFPMKTIGPDNLHRPETIDWNGAITQLASWSVAGTIQPIDMRFEDLVSRHVSQPDSPKKTTREKLMMYKTWGKERIEDFCKYIGIEPDDFLDHLRDKLFGEDPNAQEKSDELIRRLFDREPKPGEFLPISSSYKYLATSIMNINDAEQKRLVEKMLEKPAVFLRAARRYGLIEQEGEKSYKSKTKLPA